MKIFANRKFAISIAVAAAVLATLLGVRGSLNRLARDAEATFYDGVYLKDEGYTQPAIDTYISRRIDTALRLAAAMDAYPELAGGAEALMSARRSLSEAKSIREKFTENEKMQRVFVELVEKARGLELSERDREEVENCSSTFSGAQTAIQNSRYNQHARSFMDGASILARVLKPFLFVSQPQVFA